VFEVVLFVIGENVQGDTKTGTFEKTFQIIVVFVKHFYGGILSNCNW